MSSVDDLVQQLEAIQLQEARLVAQIKRARELERAAAAAAGESSNENFVVGQRVRILNRVIFPGDREAIVTVVKPGRINITTTNGVKTWRAPKNLESR